MRPVRELATIRSVPLPGPSTMAWVVAAGPPPGPCGRRGAGPCCECRPSTGVVLTRAVLPSGHLGALAAGPGGENLYAAAARLPKPYWAVVLEYSAGTGRLLAQSDGATLGRNGRRAALLTAVPEASGSGSGVPGCYKGKRAAEREVAVGGGRVPDQLPTGGLPGDRGQDRLRLPWAMGSRLRRERALWVTTTGGLLACVSGHRPGPRRRAVTSGQAWASTPAARTPRRTRWSRSPATISNTTGFTCKSRC